LKGNFKNKVNYMYIYLTNVLLFRKN